MYTCLMKTETAWRLCVCVVFCIGFMASPNVFMELFMLLQIVFCALFRLHYLIIGLFCTNDKAFSFVFLTYAQILSVFEGLSQGFFIHEFDFGAEGDSLCESGDLYVWIAFFDKIVKEDSGIIGFYCGA